MKIEIGKEYVQAGFPDTKVKVLGPITGMPGVFWCEVKIDVVCTEKYNEDGSIYYQNMYNKEKYQLIEKPLKCTKWFNVWKDYKGNLYLGNSHSTKESCIEADNRFPPNERAVGRKKITLVEGEFDE